MEVRRFVGLLWLLSGLPCGVALILLPASARLACFALFVLLETGHSLSPIALAWTHTGFRKQVIYQRKGQCVVLPLAIFLVAVFVGTVTSSGLTTYSFALPHQMLHITDWTNPFPVVVWIYWLWNIYHFGMQHFGVMQILRIGWGRYVNISLCLAASAFGMAVVPMLTSERWVFFLMTGVFSVNHWVVDIGLSARVAGHRWWLFAGIILILGAVGFVWMVPTSQGTMIRIVPIVICARLGLGFVHFLYSRWVWKLGDPQVRATIGRDLLTSREPTFSSSCTPPRDG